MKYYALLYAAILFSCQSNQQNTNRGKISSQSNNCFEYPSDVDSLQLRALYDSARWYVYTWSCDIFYLSKNDSLKYKTFGELELKFDNLLIKHDTVELNFNFVDRGQAILPSMMKDHKELVTGVGFDLNSKRKIYMSSPSGFSETLHGGANRYENPLQPEVLNYIKVNWEKLNACFRKLAEQKGIIK
jgi:hypothetical protein